MKPHEKAAEGTLLRYCTFLFATAAAHEKVPEASAAGTSFLVIRNEKKV
ncbi:hypothetical protein [Succinimonas sp.]